MEPVHEVRDIREQPFLWLDNRFVDNYMHMLTLTAVNLYVILCRFANSGTQQCHPSQSRLTAILKIKKKETVRLAAKELSGLGLISTQHVGVGPDSRVIYTILRIPPVDEGSPLKTAHNPPSEGSVIPPARYTELKEYNNTKKQFPGEQTSPGILPFKLTSTEPEPPHERCRKAVFEYYRANNRTDPPWTGREGKALANLLAAMPGMTPEMFRQCLRHRHQSTDNKTNHGERQLVG